MNELPSVEATWNRASQKDLLAFSCSQTEVARTFIARTVLHLDRQPIEIGKWRDWSSLESTLLLLAKEASECAKKIEAALVSAKLR